MGEVVVAGVGSGTSNGFPRWYVRDAYGFDVVVEEAD